MIEGTPPDARTGNTANVQEHHNGQLNGYGQVNVPEQADLHAMMLNGPAPLAQSTPLGSRFQETAGTETYFQFIEFACSQMYKGLPIGELDRMDLLAAFGMLLGEHYQSQAVAMPARGGGQAEAPKHAQHQQRQPHIPPEIAARLGLR